ncbi:MAG: catalase [Clostridia bacterium]|nr:catalase [Clostridia bacterium]
MNKFFGHLNTIIKHRRKVIYHCYKVGILRRGLLHDLSKYAPIEFFEGVRFFTGTKSPNEGERAKKGYSEAWMHHKDRNRHHFEYWTDYNPETKMVAPVKMPIVFVKEMFCDRVAASKVYQGKNYTDAHPVSYFTPGKARRSIHPETSDLLESWLIMLKEKGEKETFSHIKSIKEY